MGDARMRRQFSHGLTVRGQRFAFERAESLQQIPCLCIGRRRWHIEPDQFARSHAPTPELQRQARQVRRKNFRAAVSGELFVLVL